MSLSSAQSHFEKSDEAVFSPNNNHPPLRQVGCPGHPTVDELHLPECFLAPGRNPGAAEASCQVKGCQRAFALFPFLNGWLSLQHVNNTPSGKCLPK